MLHAVLVGIDRYKDPDIRPLRYARADAEELAKLFESRIHPSDRLIHLLRDEEATKENVMVEIGDSLVKVVAQDDVIVLFFAGHGSPETATSLLDASRYLVMHDTRQDRLFGTAIDMERELKALLERLGKARLILLFIDACFSGGAGGRTFEGPHLRQVRAEHRGSRFSLVSLDSLDFGRGRLILTACNDEQVARESRAMGHGIFSFHLLAALQRPRESGTVSILTLCQELVDGVRGATGGRQIPVINGRLEDARFPSLGQL
jgi:uncharacterized caspase-like protein